MQIEDITEVLNQYLKKSRQELNLNIGGKFVVKRNIITKKPPIFKKFIIELYYISSIGDNKLCITIEQIEKCPSNSENTYWNEVYKSYVLEIFKFIKSETFSRLIHGIVNTNK